MAKDNGFSFDFSGTTPAGQFVVIPPGKYLAVVTEMYARKKENNNRVLDVDFCIDEGDYAGTMVRYFHTINADESKAAKSRAFFLSLLINLGIVNDDEVGTDKTLKADAVFGGKDEKGRVEVTAFTVNGKRRPVGGKKVMLTISNRPNQQTGADSHWVDRVDKAPVDTANGEQTPTSDIPF